MNLWRYAVHFINLAGLESTLIPCFEYERDAVAEADSLRAAGCREVRIVDRGISCKS